MNHSAAELSEIVTTVVNRYMRRVSWARKPDVRADLTGRAWLTLLETIEKGTFDPQVGISERAYLERAVALSLKQELFMIAHPVSNVSAWHRSADELEEFRATKRLFGEENIADNMSTPATGAKRLSDGADHWISTPLQQIAHREWEERGNWADRLLADKSWRARAKQAIAEVAEVAEESETATVALGLEVIATNDGEAQYPKRFAEEHDLPITKVYRAVERAKLKIRERRVCYDLAKELDK